MNFKRLFLKKSIAAIQAESQGGGLKRSLGALNLISLGIGCIIGAGIFVLTGSAAANHAGPAIMLSFVLVGTACALVAFCYAELASLLPVSGSAYTYAYATLGEIFAWAMGLLLVLEYGLASATVAVGWSGYVNNILMSMGAMMPPELAGPYGTPIKANETFSALYTANGYGVNAEGFLISATGAVVHGLFNLPAFLGVMAVTALLILGISESAKVNNVIVVIKVTVVLLFIIVGIFHVDPALWQPFVPDAVPVDPAKPEVTKYGWGGVLAGAGAIFFAYIGFEAVSTAAQETKNPQRDLPIGILGSLAVCTVLYILVAAVLTGIVPYEQLGVAEPIALAVDRMQLPWLSYAVKIGAITGLSSVMLVLVYGQTRIFFMMGKDGLLPSFFCKLHSRFQTPYINTIFVGSCVAIAAAVTPIRVLGDLVSMGTLFAFTIVCFSVLYMRYKEPNIVRPYRCPLVPIIPVGGILLCIYLMYGLGAAVFIQLKFYFLAGLLIYVFYGRFKSKLQQENSNA